MDGDKDNAVTLVAAPGSLTVSGLTLLVSKLNNYQVFAVYEWALERAKKLYNPFTEVMAAIEGLPLTSEERQGLLSQAHHVKLSGDVPGDLLTKCMRSREGVAFTLWIATREQHPELTCERCNELVTDANRLDVYCQLDVASGANVVQHAMEKAGFFPPALSPESTGSSVTAVAP